MSERQTTRIRAASQWIDEQISAGKLMEICECERGHADDLAGALMNAVEEKVKSVSEFIERKIKSSESALEEAKRENKSLDAAAESASRLAYVSVQSQIRLHLSAFLK